jgi:hypothetical protein
MKELSKEQKLIAVRRLDDFYKPPYIHLCNVMKEVIVRFGLPYYQHYNTLKKKYGSNFGRDVFLEETFPEFIDFIINEGRKLDKHFALGESWKIENNAESFRRKKIKEFQELIKEKYNERTK